jgi:hypothetical protein
MAMDPETWKTVTKSPAALKSKEVIVLTNFSIQERLEGIQR